MVSLGLVMHFMAVKDRQFLFRSDLHILLSPCFVALFVLSKDKHTLFKLRKCAWKDVQETNKKNKKIIENYEKVLLYNN